MCVHVGVVFDDCFVFRDLSHSIPVVRSFFSRLVESDFHVRSHAGPLDYQSSTLGRFLRTVIRTRSLYKVFGCYGTSVKNGKRKTDTG